MCVARNFGRQCSKESPKESFNFWPQVGTSWTVPTSPDVDYLGPHFINSGIPAQLRGWSRHLHGENAACWNAGNVVVTKNHSRAALNEPA